MKLFKIDLLRSFAIGFLIGAAGLGIVLAFDSPADASDSAPFAQTTFQP